VSAVLRANLHAALAETRLRALTISRYPGLMLMEVMIPLMFTAMPLLLGRAVSGPNAAAYFSQNAGTTEYVPFLLMGSTLYILVNRAFWDLGYWLRHEQQIGTLEAISLTPTHTLVLASGVGLYSAVRSLVAGSLAYLVGCLAFGVNPFAGNLLLAGAFLLVGMIPLYGIGFLMVSLVLRVQESAQLLRVMQWGASLVMGIFYPVILLPPLLRAMAHLFPPAWMLNGIRASVLDLSYFLGAWWLDLAVLWSAMILVPLLGIQVFERTHRRLRTNQGVGAY
jgi:ABC-2 type transport system permease protein